MDCPYYEFMQINKGNQQPRAKRQTPPTTGETKSPTETVSITRTFDVPVLNSEHLGNMPSDKYEPNWFGFGTTWTRTESHGCYGGKCTAGPESVYRKVPQYDANGSPLMQTVTETLTEESYNAKTRSLVMAGIGAAMGIAGSALGGAMMGTSPWAPVALGVSAALGAAGGYALGHKTAAGDKVKEVWETRSIDHPTMTGYTETIRPETYEEEVNCRQETRDDGTTKRVCDTETKVRGYWHTYEPDISWRQVGSYERPTLQHTNAVGPVGAGAITVAGAGLLGVGVKALLSAL